MCAEPEVGDRHKVLERPEVAECRGRDTLEGVCNLYRYVWANCDAVDYLAYGVRGRFTDSGAIESGNETVTRERTRDPSASTDSGAVLGPPIAP